VCGEQSETVWLELRGEWWGAESSEGRTVERPLFDKRPCRPCEEK